MRINAITPNYTARTFTRNNQRNNNTQTNPSFNGEKKHSNTLLKGAQGLMLLSALSAAPSCSDFIGGEENIDITQVHNVPAKTDSVKVISPPIIIHTTDTIEKPIYIPGKDSIIYRDSIIHHYDTIPGEDRYIPYEKPLDPEISQKDKENAEEVGIETEGDGDYVMASHFFNAYEGYDEYRELDMDLCARNGSKYVYNAIRTGYTDDPESGISKVILGKNQQFVRYEYSLSNDKKTFTVKTFVPIDDISISNNREERSWDVFDNQLKAHGKWKELQSERGRIDIQNVKGGMLSILSGGVKVGEASKGDEYQSVKYVNSYDGERKYTNIHVIMGGKYEPFPNPEDQEKYEQNKVDK